MTSGCAPPAPLSSKGIWHAVDFHTAAMISLVPSKVSEFIADYRAARELASNTPQSMPVLHNLCISLSVTHEHLSHHVPEAAVDIPPTPSFETEHKQLLDIVGLLLREVADKLETLYLVQWDPVTASLANRYPLTIPAIAFPNLRVLTLVGCVTIGAGAGPTFPALTQLELVASKTAISSWAPRAPRLTHLRVVDCRGDVYEELKRLVCGPSHGAKPAFTELQKIEAQPYRTVQPEDPYQVVCGAGDAPTTDGRTFTAESLETLLNGGNEVLFSVLPTREVYESCGWDGEAEMQKWLEDIQGRLRVPVLGFEFVNDSDRTTHEKGCVTLRTASH